VSATGFDESRRERNETKCEYYDVITVPVNGIRIVLTRERLSASGLDAREFPFMWEAEDMKRTQISEVTRHDKHVIIHTCASHGGTPHHITKLPMYQRICYPTSRSARFALGTGALCVKLPPGVGCASPQRDATVSAPSAAGASAAGASAAGASAAAPYAHSVPPQPRGML